MAFFKKSTIKKVVGAATRKAKTGGSPAPKSPKPTTKGRKTSPGRRPQPVPGQKPATKARSRGRRPQPVPSQKPAQRTRGRGGPRGRRR